MSDPRERELVVELTKVLAKQVYGDALHPGMERVGLAVGSALDIVLTPLLLAAHPFQKLRIALRESIRLFEERLRRTDDENLQPAPTEISVPAIQRLQYVSDEHLRGMYIELLAKACDSKLVDQAHPAYLHIIDRLSPDEALIIRHLCTDGGGIVLTVHLVGKEHTPGGFEMTRDISALGSRVSLRFPLNDDVYLANLSAIGILERHLKEVPGRDKDYRALEKELIARLTDPHRGGLMPTPSNAAFLSSDAAGSIFAARVYYEVTALGWSFFSAIAPDEPGAPGRVRVNGKVTIWDR